MVSLGVASVVPGTDYSARRLVEVADRGLYSAKQAGRNRVGLVDRAASAKI
jgi:PleD family two-component response regulator